MADSVELLVNGRRITQFESYRIEADLYQAADEFSLELSNPEEPVKAGMQCQLKVNGQLELTGLIDRAQKRFDKSGGIRLSVTGRDLMGLLVDSYCEAPFKSVEGKTVKQVAEMLLPKVPYVNRAVVMYEENFKGKLKGKKRTVDQPAAGFLDTPQKISQIEPGMTVFDVLSRLAASRGFMFYQLPNGTFVFGRPKGKGAEPAFSLTVSRARGICDVVEGMLTDDISKRYSKITVMTQAQGFDDFGGATKVNAKASVEDKTFPFYKPYVMRTNNDSQSPKLHARMLLEAQRHQGWQLEYKVPRHSQNGRNWTINEICQASDDGLDVSGPFLIYGRVFELSKAGSFTTLRLGPPGLVAQ